jgi:hypothetical protein
MARVVFGAPAISPRHTRAPERGPILPAEARPAAFAPAHRPGAPRSARRRGQEAPSPDGRAAGCDGAGGDGRRGRQRQRERERERRRRARHAARPRRPRRPCPRRARARGRRPAAAAAAAAPQEAARGRGGAVGRALGGADLGVRPGAALRPGTPAAVPASSGWSAAGCRAWRPPQGHACGKCRTAPPQRAPAHRVPPRPSPLPPSPRRARSPWTCCARACRPTPRSARAGARDGAGQGSARRRRQRAAGRRGFVFGHLGSLCRLPAGSDPSPA